MIQYKSNCRVCQAIREDRVLLDRISKTSYFISISKDSLRKIADDHKGEFSYESLLNHAKKHHKISATKYKKEVLKDLMVGAENKALKKIIAAQTVQDAVIEKGMEKLENGELKLTTDHLLRAARDKQDAEGKVRDQQLQLAEMVAFFASGEDNQGNNGKIYERAVTIPDYNPAVPVTEDSQTWQD